jgi:hypothetical protein
MPAVDHPSECTGARIRYLGARMRLRPCLAALAAATAAAAVLAVPATAPAQTAAPPVAQPPPPPPPPAPDLVLSGRNVRLTRSNVVGIRMGCRAAGTAANEACIGSLTIRLANALTIQVDPPGNRPNQRPRNQRINPFNFGVRDFTLGVGDATQLRLRLSPRAAQLIRDQERVRADLIANYNSRAGAQGSARRNVRIYFVKRPGV